MEVGKVLPLCKRISGLVHESYRRWSGMLSLYFCIIPFMDEMVWDECML